MTPADWRPSATVATARRRAAMLDGARRFFAERGVLEVDTPALSPSAVSDPHIDSLRVELAPQPGCTWYLRTSPEYPMKRLLCAGYPDIYEIARVFRDGEAGPRHQPEFTLIEWYRRGFDLDEMMHETVAMLTGLIEPSRLGGPPQYQSYTDAFRDSVGIDPLSAEVHALRRSADVDTRLEESLGDRRDDWLDLLLATRVAPSFAVDRLTVLHRYPASQAALARLNPDDPSVADRFEVFHGAVELANGFVELTDAAEQAQRFATDQAQRQSLGKSTAPIDDRFLAALQSGLPDCAGVAVGLERVLMINEAAADIRAILTFPFEAS